MCGGLAAVFLWPCTGLVQPQSRELQAPCRSSGSPEVPLVQELTFPLCPVRECSTADHTGIGDARLDDLFNFSLISKLV